MGDIERMKSAKRRPPLVAAAAAMHAVVSTEELRDAGLSHHQVAHLVAIGFLHPRHQGVYVVGRPEIGFVAQCRAALLAGGPCSAICGPTASRWWGVPQGDERIHIAVPRGRRFAQSGLVIHRPRSLPEADICERDGIRVTNPGRTLLDLSPRQSVERIGGWIHELGVQFVFDAQETWAVTQRNPHHRGRLRLEAALELEVLPTRSGLEREFLAICRRAGLPTPDVNATLSSATADEEVDFHWPQWRLIVETDGDRFHSSRWRQRRDAAKDERFRQLGWTVERVPELAITLDPAGVGRRLTDIVRSMSPTA